MFAQMFSTRSAGLLAHALTLRNIRKDIRKEALLDCSTRIEAYVVWSVCFIEL